MSFEAIGYDVEASGVATITLDHADDRNALSDGMLGELIRRRAHASGRQRSTSASSRS